VDVGLAELAAVGVDRQAAAAGVQAVADEVLGLADFGDTGQVAFDVSRKYRNTGARKPLRHYLQRHGLAGSGGALEQDRRPAPSRLRTVQESSQRLPQGLDRRTLAEKLRQLVHARLLHRSTHWSASLEPP